MMKNVIIETRSSSGIIVTSRRTIKAIMDGSKSFWPIFAVV
jgi:hypothetical protein